MALLTYDISVTGMESVERAFGSIEARARAHNQAMAGLAQRGARESQTALGKVTAGSGRAEAQVANDVTRAKKDELAISKQIAAEDRKRHSEAKTAYREMKAAGRDRLRAAQQESREMERMQAKAQQIASARYNRVSHVAGNVWNNVSGVGGMVAGLAGIGGGALFATAAHSQIQTIALASKLANQFSGNGATLGQLRSTKAALLKESEGVDGYSRDEVLQAMATYHEKTGAADSARRMVKGMAGLSLATGSELNDVAGFGSSIHMNLKNAGMTDAEAEKATMGVLNNAAMQAKEKSVEMKNFAAIGGTVISQSAFLTGDKAENMKLGMAVTQMAQADSPEEKATAYQNMIGDMVKHQKQIKKLGIKDSIKGGKLDLIGTLGQILDSTGGDVEKAMKVYNIRGLRAFTGLQELHAAGEKEKPGSGRAKVEAELRRLSTSELSQETIRAGVASRMEDPDMQIKAAYGKLNAAIGQELVPVITKLIPSIAQAAPLLGQLARALAGVVAWFAGNPLQGIGVVVAASVAKEIASAAIGEAVKRALLGALSPGMGGGVGGGGFGGVGGGTARRRIGGGKGGGGALPGGGTPKQLGSGQSAIGLLGAGATGLSLGFLAYEGIYEGAKAEIDATRGHGRDALGTITDTGSAGGQYDKAPVDPKTGKPVDESAEEKAAREKKSKQMGLKRNQAMLMQILDARMKLDAEDKSPSILGMVEGFANGGGALAIPFVGAGIVAAQQAGVLGKVDLTGRGDREQQRKLLDAREQQVKEGHFNTAEADLKDYSNERSESGFKPINDSAEKLNEVAVKLGESAAAQKRSAEAITSAVRALPGALNRSETPTPKPS